MKKLLYCLLFFFFVQLIAPLSVVLGWGAGGILVGSLTAAVAVPLGLRVLKRSYRHLLSQAQASVWQEGPEMQVAPALFVQRLLPHVKVMGTLLSRCITPVTYVLLLVCLCGVPDLLLMLLVSLECLYVLLILILAALVMLGEACPGLLSTLLRMGVTNLLQAETAQARSPRPIPVIHMADTHSEYQVSIPVHADSPSVQAYPAPVPLKERREGP